MRSSRRAAHIPGLARLLADLPRERTANLAMRWDGGSPNRPGLAAALYRAVSDRERLTSEVQKLDTMTRLVLGRLAASPSGLSVEELGLRLPFADEAIGHALDQLNEIGLAWPLDPPDREHVKVARRWFVPRDLASSVIAATRAAHDLVAAPGPVPPVQRHAGKLERAAVANLRVSPGGEAREHLFAFVDRRAESMTIESDWSPRGFAMRSGVALGVLDRQGSVVRLGPRADQWSKLAPADQTRALARVWLVDDTLSGRVPGRVRAQVVRALRTAQPYEWYDVGSIARVAADQMSEPILPVDGRESPTEYHRPDHVVSRNDVVQAIAGLQWIGVLDVAADARGLTRAVRLTATGLVALA
jgi:hypothetical protein